MFEKKPSDIPLAFLRLAAIAWEIAQDATKREAEEKSKGVKVPKRW